MHPRRQNPGYAYDEYSDVSMEAEGAVALLRLVSPGALTDGVTLFYLKSDDLFSDRPTKLAPSPLFRRSFVQCSCKASRKNIYTFIRV